MAFSQGLGIEGRQTLPERTSFWRARARFNGTFSRKKGLTRHLGPISFTLFEPKVTTEKRTMSGKIATITTIAVVALFAVSDVSLAASKKSRPNDERCLGGGCTSWSGVRGSSGGVVGNPDRERPDYYKRSSKKRKPASSRNAASPN